MKFRQGIIIIIASGALLGLAAGCGQQSSTTKKSADATSTQSKKATKANEQTASSSSSDKTVATASSTTKQEYTTWKNTYIETSGKQAFVKTNDGSGATTAFSEGQAYGLLITVNAAQQGMSTHAEFDALDRYVVAHHSKTAAPIMAWRQTERNGQMTSDDSESNGATDGDINTAVALLQAGKLWGNSGAINYHQQALALIKAIKAKEMNPTTHLPRLGNWATTTPQSDYVRSSDLTPTTFTEFAKVTGDSFWTKAATNSNKALVKLSNHTTGLYPDFASVSGKQLTVQTVAANAVESSTDPTYAYNACRMPWVLAASVVAGDTTVKPELTKLLQFFTTQTKVMAGYTVDGQATQTYQHTAFIAPLVYAAKVTGDTSAQSKFDDQLTGLQANYYGDTLNLLMTLLGNAN